MEPQAIGTNIDGLAVAVHDIATVLEREGSVRAVFGDPVKLDTRTIIPVATVALGGGGGGITGRGTVVDVIRRRLGFKKDVRIAPTRRSGGGGGMGIDVRPVGFLSEEDGRVVFTKIDDGRRLAGRVEDKA
jgi:uncharacterized spore protein YtfJ